LVKATTKGRNKSNAVIRQRLKETAHVFNDPVFNKNFYRIDAKAAIDILTPIGPPGAYVEITGGPDVITENSSETYYAEFFENWAGTNSWEVNLYRRYSSPYQLATGYFFGPAYGEAEINISIGSLPHGIDWLYDENGRITGEVKIFIDEDTYDIKTIGFTLPKVTLSSSITSSTTLVPDYYNVPNGCTISNNATLTIQAGAKFFIGSSKKIVVNSGSKILSNGTSSNTVKFMRASPNNMWDKLEIYGNGNRFYYTVFDGGYDNLYLRSNDNKLEHCTCQNADRFGLYGYKCSNGSRGSVEITNSIFQDNKYGMRLAECDLNLINCTIRNNSHYGVSIVNGTVGYSSTRRFKKNYIYGNGTNGIVIGPNGSLSLGQYYNGNNKITYNGNDEIYLNNWSSRLCAGNVSSAANGGEGDIYDTFGSGGYYNI
jgi:hypothetical protein